RLGGALRALGPGGAARPAPAALAARRARDPRADPAAARPGAAGEAALPPRARAGGRLRHGGRVALHGAIVGGGVPPGFAGRGAVPVALLAALAGGQAAAARLSRTLEVTFLAVGQGDAALVRFPGGRAMLVDAGGDLFGARAGGDPGRTRVVPALAELGVGR